MTTTDQRQDVPPATVISFREFFWTWARVAALSFGGPAGQIAVMHRILVDEKKWIREARFLHALNYCMLLPGPEAQQLATYIGWLLRGPWGGLLAGGLFILPGALAILALSLCYVSFQSTALLQAIFYGLKPAVIAIVIEAALRIGRRVLKNRTMVAVAVASFLAISLLGVPFPVLVVLAAVLGIVGSRIAPSQFPLAGGHGKAKETAETTPEPSYYHVEPNALRTIGVLLLGLALWFAPLVGFVLALGWSSVFTQQGIFFSQAAVVTFGGAYAVLGYVQQSAVEKHGWLTSAEMVDGLALAETTPGPLIMVVQFVAFLGAYRDPGPFSPLIAGVVASALTTWVTFVPSFLWIFLGAPYVERLRGQPRWAAALSTITAAVVGVVVNLVVIFSLHTLFRTVHTQSWGVLHGLVPDWTSLDFVALGITVVALVLTFVLHRGLAVTLSVCMLLGLLFRVGLGY